MNLNSLEPRYPIGATLYFRYVPYDFIHPQTGEVVTQTPEIPCTVLAVAHNFSHDMEIGPGSYLPRVLRTDWVGFFYFVQIDQEEAALCGLDLCYPARSGAPGTPLTFEVVKENQITGERIAF